MIYNYVIIGAGISGLYTAFNIKKKYPDKTFIILEANNYIGGRTLEEKFNNQLVKTGAGIVRSSDKLLIKLLKELKVTYFKSKSHVEYTFTNVDIIKIINQLKKEFIKNKIHVTFKEFALPILGPKLYKQFLMSSGYTDYEKDDIEHVLYMYKFENNTFQEPNLYISWNELIDKLVNYIGIKNIKTNSKVIKINNNNVKTINTTYNYEKLIVATTIESLRKLIKNHIYKEIEGQPFIRVYGVVSSKYIPLMKELIKGILVVDNILQKILAINPDKGLYMFGYADNKNANKIYNDFTNKEYLENLIKQALNIDDIKLTKFVSFYRHIGTHYYKPLDTTYKSLLDFIKHAQHPKENIFVVGEVVSENQGWCEGALLSVHKINLK
jgi:hypothetical protein